MQRKSIGPYRIEKELGSGGMGEVYLAYDSRLKRQVAIKQLRSDAQMTSERRTRLRREAQAVALLNHPAIVQVYDILTEDGIDHVVMEYVDGTSLDALLRSGPLSLAQALTLGRDIAEGLAEAHSKGIVHRDLKTDNILVTPAGHAKILDFGLAKQLWDNGDDSVSVEGTLVGTCTSMSPEQASGKRIDHRSDLFSFGILLYHMATGQPPFTGSTPLSTLHQIINDPQPRADEINPELPGALCDLLDRLLEKRPERRPKHTAEVVEILDDLTALYVPRVPSGAYPIQPDEGTAGGDVSTWSTADEMTLDELRRRQARRRRRWLIATVALLILGVLIVVAMWPEKPARPLRVAVPEVRYDGDSPDGRLISAIVRSAVQRGLISLEGIVVPDPAEVEGIIGSPSKIAQGTGSDEALTAEVTLLDDESCRIELSRIDKNGELLWTEGFEALILDPRLLSDAVISYLRHGYPGLELRPGGIPDLEVRPQDYRRYLELRHMTFAGDRTMSMAQILASLPEVRHGSPRFLETYLLEARVARYLYRVEGREDHLLYAFDLLEQARKLAPGDPRVAHCWFEVSLTANDHQQATEALGRLEELVPGALEILIARAQLADQQGRKEDALQLLLQAVALRASWRSLMMVADLELRMGRVSDARAHLETILDMAPKHYSALSKLAQLEMISGDLKRAEELYLTLVERSPEVVTLSNLGVSRFLLGRYADAAESFYRALELQQDNPGLTLNLADCEHLLGHAEEAKDLYKKVVELTVTATNDWQAQTVRGQALAHLGRYPEAVRAIELALQLEPEEARAAYSAAIVYTLIDDLETALDAIERALENGFEPHWFTLPWFSSLQDNPDFEALLERFQPTESASSDRRLVEDEGVR